MRHTIDVADMGRLAQRHPAMVEVVESGEAKLAAGDAESAAAIFHRAATEAPESAVAARRECQALTELERKDEALVACRLALTREGSPMNSRAMVGALMAGPKAPTADDLVQATMFASGIGRTMPREPLLFAAQFDIAWRLGDSKMLEAALTELRRIDPAHYETRRAETMVASLQPGASLWLGWAAILLAAIATLVHTVMQRIQTPRAA